MKIFSSKFTSRYVVFFVVLLSMMCTLASSLPTFVKVLICAALLVVYFYIKSTENSFDKGVTLLHQNKIDEALIVFEKVLKENLTTEQRLAVASVFVQYGKIEEGLDIIENLKDSTKDDLNLFARSESIKSIGFWNSGEKEKAIQILQNVIDVGYEDDNILTTLCVYLLYLDQISEVEKYLNKKSYSDISSGMLDNYLWLNIAKEDWKNAEIITKELNSRNITFPEARYHLAIVAVHQNKGKEALQMLEECLTMSFVPNAVITKQVVQSFYDAVLQCSLPQLQKELEGKYKEVAKGAYTFNK